LLYVIVDSPHVVSEASFSAWVPLDPFVTIVRRVAVLTEALPSEVKSNFIYAAMTGEPSELKVFAPP